MIIGRVTLPVSSLLRFSSLCILRCWSIFPGCQFYEHEVIYFLIILRVGASTVVIPPFILHDLCFLHVSFLSVSLSILLTFLSGTAFVFHSPPLFCFWFHWNVLFPPFKCLDYIFSYFSSWGGNMGYWSETLAVF